jgi:hypothetical protein
MFQPQVLFKGIPNMPFIVHYQNPHNLIIKRRTKIVKAGASAAAILFLWRALNPTGAGPGSSGFCP